MFHCVLCRFDVELDDCIAPTSNGGCVCVRCFARETETELLMPKDLRRDVIATLAGTVVS